MAYGYGRKRWIVPAVMLVLGGAMVLPAADEPAAGAKPAIAASAEAIPASPEQRLIDNLRSMALVDAPDEPQVALAVARAPVVEPRAAGPEPVTQSAAAMTAVVNAGALNVRSGPSSSQGVVGRLVRDAEVEVIGEANGWRQISTSDGVTGWVYGDYLRMNG
ncbi:SH3 domain-containing protein [Devosia enhydra]|uniref:SH3 domain-containing protein n=1 Tax=Devosia enhydra TaxID=665118 RepID=A0A1K2I1S6_9HYPH|nr:SH3 domain-containing protein [Devosia enhydra]SFZ86346.1 SH3 domain-containing protein [Devosia enhydra]